MEAVGKFFKPGEIGNDLQVTDDGDKKYNLGDKDKLGGSNFLINKQGIGLGLLDKTTKKTGLRKDYENFIAKITQTGYVLSFQDYGTSVWFFFLFVFSLFL